MTIRIDEIKQQLLSKINYADEDELIELYEKLFNVKIVNHGDGWFPCYVIEKMKKEQNNYDTQRSV